MTDEQRDLLATEALGALPHGESEHVHALVASDPAAARALEEYRGTVAMLEARVAREAPSYDLFAGILADLAPASPQASTGRSWSWRRALPAFAVGAAATAAAFALALGLGSAGGLGTPDAVAAVQGTSEFTGVRGEARIYAADTSEGVLRLELADVPSPPEGAHYEVWVLRPSAGDTMEAVGVFDPTSAEVSLELRLPGAGDYAAVDISIEPDAWSPEHSGRSLAGGEFGRETA
jgi:anti-sigma-K factor RskA